MGLNAYEHPGWMHPQLLAFDPDVSCTSNGIQNEIHCGLQPEFHRFWCLIAWDTKLTYRSASLFIKPRFGGVFAFRVGQMNDCPRRYAQKNAAYRSASLFMKPRFDGFFAFWAGCYA